MKALLPAAVLAAALGLTLAAAPAAPAAKKPAAAGDATLAQIDKMVADAKVDKTHAAWRTKLTKPQVATFAADRNYLVKMETNKGLITIKMLPDGAPMHVTSFLYLARLGFFDGLNFHRVIPGFMAQGGDPLGNGTGGPGYEFPGEIGPGNRHDRPGLLSMANRGPGTDGSQFFITFVPTPFLDAKHTIFGEVVEGMDVLKKLEAAGSESGRTSEPLKIVKVTVDTAAKG
jgi:peptidyl-prolyl cis-trans isomerase B (cyclophilin B)